MIQHGYVANPANRLKRATFKTAHNIFPGGVVLPTTQLPAAPQTGNTGHHAEAATVGTTPDSLLEGQHSPQETTTSLAPIAPPEVTSQEGTATQQENDSFEERAAICEFDGGLPREWAEGLARLCVMPRPDDINPRRWQSIINAAAIFSDKWARQASEMGWTVEQCFGVHQVAPSKRFDHQGLLWSMSVPGETLIELTANMAVFEVGRHRHRQTMRRDLIMTHEQRLLWEVSK